MMKQFLTTLFAVCTLALGCGTAIAQNGGEFSGGFKAGLNFNNFDAPLENDGEQFKTNAGFHIGATFLYAFTDIVGVKAELMYSQKGTQYTYDGPSYFTFYSQGNQVPIYATGTRKMDISIANSYLDIPVMAYFRLGKLELELGPSLGLLIGSRGSGGVTFSGTTIGGTVVQQFNSGIDYNYFGDLRGAAAIKDGRDITLNTVLVVEPDNLDAYYESAPNDGKKYNRLDLGLNAGLAFFLREGLYIGVRGNYGLSDLTNEEQDLSLSQLLNNSGYSTRDDEDHNLSIQASVGFRF